MKQKRAAKSARQTEQLRAEKEELALLYTNDNRPNPEDEETGEGTYYLVMNEFIRIWRQMVRNGSYQPVEIHNKQLLCDHGGLERVLPSEYVESSDLS